MPYPHSHKTVLVLDHTPAFTKSSQQIVDFDAITKSKGVPLPKISKSLWTCTVEACLEFSRIIYDIFPSDKWISVIASGADGAKGISKWRAAEQSLQYDQRTEADETSIMHGLTAAIERLCEPTDKQREIIGRADLKNRGRIICLTSFKSPMHVRVLEDCMENAIVSHNEVVVSKKGLLPIDHCDLVFVHVTPVGVTGSLTARKSNQVSSLLTSELHVTQAGPYIAHKMVELAMQHYSLASTTITGIPMKEEQNASSSANYDVELLHSKEAHNELFKTGGHSEEIVIASKEGLCTETVCLKWCSPKTSVVELQQCHGAYRITPVDVNSRPSSCLTNFLLSGRAVMLEQPRKSGAKVISHMLSCHGGEIFIHVLTMSRSILEDPPSISEGCGGRVTDYRIKDFGELMKDSRLAPAPDASHLEELPIDRAKAQLERMTRHWPMVISETVIFNMLSHLDPLPSLIVKETLTEEDVQDCKRAVLYLVDLEARGDSLPIPNSGTRGKGPKREEQYRMMWRECEKLVRCHANNTPKHQEVLECLLQCKGSTGPPSPKPDSKPADNIKTEDKGGFESSMKTFDSYQKLTEREKRDLNTIKRETESPPVKKIKTEFSSKPSAGQSVLSMWLKQTAQSSRRRTDFTGRLEAIGNKAELYTNPKPDAAPMTNEAPTPLLKPLLKKSSAFAS